MSSFIRFLYPVFILSLLAEGNVKSQELSTAFADPPREFSVMPFWFWNDTLKEKEIIRQIADFEAHGVYGFVIHPRIGLPQHQGWLSPEMIRFMHVAIDEAARRKMYVVLYDEGMYPSGSSSGQVVARNPAHAARGLSKIDLKDGENPDLSEGTKLVTIVNRDGGQRVAVIEKPSGGVIRGIHYQGEGSGRLREDTPPAGDILNPEAVTSFIELVYDRFAKEFGSYFGSTVLGIFTDEPSPLGRGGARGIVPGNAGLFPQINRILGYDFRPFLADLWYADRPESMKHRDDYNRAINSCLEENYYKRLGEWCKSHGIALMGHPAGSMDIGTERYFQVPGQDLVWRYVEPGPKALEGQHSTMAKCASSAMIHLGLRRNSNELYGAYGHDLTYEEMVWLANWCFVRGHNLLFPHAFYYSIRGPRFDERPPDVGPHAMWWNNYKPYADACRRLSWLNTDSKQICEVAVLAEPTYLPDAAAKVLYQNQFDFNYLEFRHLLENTIVDKNGIKIAGMNYKVLVVDSLSYLPSDIKPALEQLAKSGRLIWYRNNGNPELFPEGIIPGTPEELLAGIAKNVKSDLHLTPSCTAIRYRHVVKGNDHYYLLFNEGNLEVSVKPEFMVKGTPKWINPYTAEVTSTSSGELVTFRPYEMKIVRIGF